MLETVRNAWKIDDLRKKIIYSLIIIALFRIGSVIPVPFIDANTMKTMILGSGNLLGYVDLLSGGAFSQCTVFALGISPYITASIVIQLLTIAIPYLEELSKQGEEGKKKLEKITRYTVVGLAFLQAFAYSAMIRNWNALHYEGIELYFAQAVIVVTFTAGAMLVVYLGERIDKNGIGNGISLILFAGIVSRGPSTVTTLWGYLQLARAGNPLYYVFVPLVVVIFIIMIAFIVFMTNAERRIPVQYAKRVVGRKQYGGQSTYLPIKVNMSGVLPVIFASSLLAIPGTIQTFVDPAGTGWFAKFAAIFNYNTVWYAMLYFVLIILFNYFYVSVQYNVVEISNNLRKNSGTIPGIRPGKPTADFINRVVGRTTFMGAIFLAVIAILPIGFGALTQMNISLGGTSIIILVGVAIETVRSLESQMMMRHYKGFLES